MSQIFGEFVASLNERGVRYLVIGGWATAFHGYPRFTKDLDILIDRTVRNAAATRDAIYDFFRGRPPETIDLQSDLLDPDRVLQLGVPPNRIDVLNQVPGIEDFDAAWKRRRPGRVGHASASFAGLGDLIASKRAVGRPQDLADVSMLDRRSGRGTTKKPVRRKSTRAKRAR
jgi:hypothetical protein